MRCVVFVSLLILRLLSPTEKALANSIFVSGNSCEEVWYPMEKIRRVTKSLSTFLDTDEAYSGRGVTIALGSALVSAHLRIENYSLTREFAQIIEVFIPTGEEAISEAKIATELGSKDHAILMMVLGDLLGHWKVISPAQYNEVSDVKRSDADVLKQIRQEGISIVSRAQFAKQIDAYRESKNTP